GIARTELFDRPETQSFPEFDQLAMSIANLHIINEVIAVALPFFRPNNARAAFLAHDYYRVYAGWQDAPMRNTRLNRVQRRISGARISQNELIGKIRAKAWRPCVGTNLRNAFPRG